MMEPRLRAGEEEEELQDEDLLEDEKVEGPRRGRNGSMRVSQQQRFRYALQIREPLRALLQAGRLFHEVCVDAFASILTDRLTWVRQNQDSIRMIKANGLSTPPHTTRPAWTSAYLSCFHPALLIRHARCIAPTSTPWR